MRKLWSLMKSILTNPYLSFVFKIYIGWLFIYASLTKIPDPAVFAENVAAYQIIPYWGINLVAVLVPALELVAGVFLILGLRVKAAAAILGGFLFLYTILTIITVLRGLSISCGCYDALGDTITWKKVIIDFVYLIMIIHVYFFDKIYLFRKGKVISIERSSHQTAV